MLQKGRYGTIDELAVAEGINGSYVCRILRLTLLAPDIVAAILGGRQPEGATLPALMERFPVEWARQKGRPLPPSLPPPMPHISNLKTRRAS